MGKHEVQRTLKEFVEDLYSEDTKERDVVCLRGFDGAKRGHYFWETATKED